MRTFRYFVFNDGEIKAIQIREQMPDGTLKIRRSLKAGSLGNLEFFALKNSEFHEVDKKDADIVFRLCDKDLDCETVESQILQATT